MLHSTSLFSTKRSGLSFALYTFWYHIWQNFVGTAKKLQNMYTDFSMYHCLPTSTKRPWFGGNCLQEILYTIGHSVLTWMLQVSYQRIMIWEWQILTDLKWITINDRYMPHGYYMEMAIGVDPIYHQTLPMPNPSPDAPSTKQMSKKLMRVIHKKQMN